MNKSTDLFRTILRILGSIAAVLYILFLIAEEVPLSRAAPFADISVYLLFLLFAVGFYFLWRNELVSGLIFIVWHIIQWILVFWVWIDGALTLILGIPIGLLGIFLLIYGTRKKKSQRPVENSE